MQTSQYIGVVGLGKMGLAIALNLRDKGFSVTGYDIDAGLRAKSAKEGIHTADSLATLVYNLPAPRLIWLMIPAGEAVAQTLEQLAALLSPGDTVIDGGNSMYKDSVKHYHELRELGIQFLDCGTSGGVSGARHGACLMAGGEKTVFERWEHVFQALAQPDGYVYTGGPGSGHFVKMVHNGIEYGMMQAMAEGFEVLQKSEYDIDYQNIAKVWNHGSVIRGWLMELAESAFAADPDLSSIKGVMNSSGEGKWTVETALDLGVPTPVIALSLFMRYRSQMEDTFSGKVVAALRYGFGGHAVVGSVGGRE
jgi:6-phosphogluconate dehydrogenase